MINLWSSRCNIFANRLTPMIYFIFVIKKSWWFIKKKMFRKLKNFFNLTKFLMNSLNQYIRNKIIENCLKIVVCDIKKRDFNVIWYLLWYLLCSRMIFFFWLYLQEEEWCYPSQVILLIKYRLATKCEIHI